MKKDLIYGVITAVIAGILLVGAVMSMPDRPEEAMATGVSPEEAASSAASASALDGTTGRMTLPVQSQAAEPITQPTELPTQAAQEETVLLFISWPKTIAGGESGTVTIRGKPNTTYSIEVHYKSGPSSAKGLEDQVSDADGMVTWTWKVSKNAKPGDFKIVVSGGGETVEVPFTVLD